MQQPYRLNSDGSIFRVTDGALIPTNQNNADYQAYQAWVAEGNTPDPAPTPVVVEPPPSPLKVLTDLLVAKNLVSQADITAAETEAGVTLNQTGAP